MFTKRLLLFLLLGACTATNTKAQLWRYLNNDPENEKTAEMAIKGEASSIITRRVIAYGDTLSYEVMTYAIQTFDSVSEKVTIFEKPFGHKLTIKCAHDRLTIGDFYCLTKVHFFRTDLLEIVYSPRGGSDQGYDNVLILGIDKGKFCIAMHAQSVNEYSIPDEYGLYELRLKPSGGTLPDFQLAVSIHEILKSGTKPSKNYDRRHGYVLKFDVKKRIFYNGVQHLNAIYKFDDNASGKDKLLAGDYPVIDLGKDVYYFIGNLWYERSNDKPEEKETMSLVDQDLRLEFGHK